MRLLPALLLCAATQAFAAPAQVAAEYQLSYAGLPIGRVNETFHRDGERYEIRSVTRSEGPLKIFIDDQITLESRGVVTAQGLKPLAFSQHRAKTDKGSVSATFDWEHGLMHSESNGESKDVELPPRTQDRISIMYQFMNLAPGAKTVTLNMSNGRKVEAYTYHLVDEGPLATPAGEFQALHYERVVTSANESHAQVWLARDRFNFPVRMLFDDSKGLRLEQTLVALSAH
jgi:hypothetical protein